MLAKHRRDTQAMENELEERRQQMKKIEGDLKEATHAKMVMKKQIEEYEGKVKRMIHEMEEEAKKHIRELNDVHE